MCSSDLPEEFDLVLDVERLSGTGKLLVGLGAFDVVIDNWHANEHRAGIHRLDGRHITEYPARVGAVFKNETRHRIVYAVRRRSVVVTVDAQDIVRFEGDLKRLSLDARTAPPKKGAFFLANELSPFRIHRACLRPVGERGTSLSTPDRCPLPAGWARWRCAACGRIAVQNAPAMKPCHARPMQRL